jgi:hypothetical protein
VGVSIAWVFFLVGLGEAGGSVRDDLFEGEFYNDLISSFEEIKCFCRPYWSYSAYT